MIDRLWFVTYVNREYWQFRRSGLDLVLGFLCFHIFWIRINVLSLWVQWLWFSELILYVWFSMFFFFFDIWFWIFWSCWLCWTSSLVRHSLVWNAFWYLFLSASSNFAVSWMYNGGGLVVWKFLYVRFGLDVVSDGDFLMIFLHVLP